MASAGLEPSTLSSDFTQNITSMPMHEQVQEIRKTQAIRALERAFKSFKNLMSYHRSQIRQLRRTREGDIDLSAAIETHEPVVKMLYKLAKKLFEPMYSDDGPLNEFIERQDELVVKYLDLDDPKQKHDLAVSLWYIHLKPNTVQFKIEFTDLIQQVKTEVLKLLKEDNQSSGFAIYSKKFINHLDLFMANCMKYAAGLPADKNDQIALLGDMLSNITAALVTV